MTTAIDTNAYAQVSPVHPNSLGRCDAGKRERGAAVTELVVILSSLLTLSLGIVQGALIYNAKTTLNYATFEAARAGAVHNAQRSYMTEALARGLMPLYGGGTDTASLTTANVRAYTDLMLPAAPSMNLGSGSRLEILSPTQEAFQDFGVTVDGQQQIPNEHLRFKPRDVGSASGVNLQDANILKIKVTYGYKLYVPLVNRVIAAALTVTDPANAAFYQADPPRLPIVAQATVRMQSNPYPDRNASSGGSGGGGGGGGGGGSTPPGTTPPGQGGDPNPNDPGTGNPGNGGGGSGGADPCADGSCGQGDPQVCASDDPAAQPTQTASVSVGNPINVVTGNKYQREVDLSLPGALAPEFTRHYNSQSKYQGPLGYGWTHTYSTKLNAVDETRIAIRQADGRNIVFRRQPSGTYEARLVSDGYITAHKSLRVWHWRNGRALTFDSDGKLLRIETPTGEALALTYDRNNRLVQVSDTQERRLAFRYYPNGRIESIVDPAGEAFRYTYDANGNLITATAPDNTTRAYHYEDRLDVHNLTGITDGRGVRFATYAYDKQDRAILSTHAGDVGRVTLAFKPDRTIVKNSKGIPSVYHTSRRHGIALVTVIEGPGCSQCGGGDIRYAYNDRLQLIETRTRDGVVLRRDYDALGRVTRTARTAGGRTELVARYEYESDLRRPRLVARPSVVAGKSHVIRVAYNGDGQPTEVREQGWSPASFGSGPFAIERRTILRYAVTGGRSVLREIDGPLSNGPTDSPEDSDITRFEYDATGTVVTAIIEPGNRGSKLEYDVYGRVTRVVAADGLDSKFSYDARGQVTQVTQVTQEGIARSYHYDPDGRLSETGVGLGSDYRPLVKLGYDEAGRNIWMAHHLGILQSYRYDTESNLLEATTQSASFKRAETYRYDSLGRLALKTGPYGATTRLTYDPRGFVESVTDSLGRARLYRYDAFGNLASVVEAANTAQAARVRLERNVRGDTQKVVAPNGALTEYAVDDFGRTVAVRSPDSGTKFTVYDTADRPIETRDALGNRTTYAYDPAGRLLSETTFAPRDGASTTTLYRWEGPLLRAVEHPNQRERYDYDIRRRLIRKTVTLVLTDGAEAHDVTRYAYDEKTGRLKSKSLPDGSTLTFRTNGQAQLVAIERRPTPLWPAQILVKDIERDLIGLRAFNYGNGIEAQFQRSPEGLLARIVHRLPHERGSTRPLTAGLDAWEWLGISPAHAALRRPPNAVATTGPQKLPGALSLPSDPDALIDHRYLWDAAGNLRHVQSHHGAQNNATALRHDYTYDAHDRLIIAHESSPAGDEITETEAVRLAPSAMWALSRYFYDSAGNRVLAQEAIADPKELGHTLKVRYTSGSNRAAGLGEARGRQLATPISYDPVGRPIHAGPREYVWNDRGQLAGVREANGDNIAYRYNHRGLRVSKTVTVNNRAQTTYFLYDGRQLAAELNTEGRIVRQYVYLGSQPLAVIETRKGKALADTDDVRAWLTASANLLKRLFDEERIVYLHLNHLGAPEMATNEKAEPLWRARYSPYGKAFLANDSTQASRASQTFVLNLRLPGQYEDEETGLYYNDYRYYDPRTGRYLTSDPLGLRAGINTYSYVKNNPLKYVDPTGLVLFAFDGTWNDRDTVLTNVALFSDLYNQEVEGPAYYVEGVGTGTISDPLIGGALGVGMRNQINTHLDNLDRYLEQGAPGTPAGQVVMIDIVGFSRGAAAARGFANEVLRRRDQGYYQRCVTIRFMGLFDTVSQTIEDVDLRIRPEVMYAAQAVALNEHRQPFSLQSIESDYGFPGGGGQIVGDVSPGERVERGFIGAHSDIGGGYCGTNLANCAEGDLYKVALNWMWQQAALAGVMMRPLSAVRPDARLGEISNPILHDESTRKNRSADAWPPEPPEDRVVYYPNDPNYTGLPTVYQDTMDILSMTTTDAERFLNRYSTPQGSSIFNATRVADVMWAGPDGYAAWLRANYYINLQ